MSKGGENTIFTGSILLFKSFLDVSDRYHESRHESSYITAGSNMKELTVFNT